MGKRKKQKIVLPPELPPDVPDDEIEVSDDDVQFVNENIDYAGFVSNLDTRSINRHVTRVADAKEDALEALYERRLRNKLLLDKEKVERVLEVDPVDALPVKTLDGKLYYRTAPEASILSENAPNEYEASGGIENEGIENEGADKGVMKLTKAERRVKLKKQKKEAKKRGKDVPEVVEEHQIPQAGVLEEVKMDLTAEETYERKKYKLAELGTQLLSDPESNLKSLREMLLISKDSDQSIVTLGLKSLLAVFRDIIPGYRIRLPSEKEQEMMVSKSVKKMRFYESTLLSAYKAYLQKLLALEEQAAFHRVAIRCICSLLEALPHFNFRESLLTSVVRNISSKDDIVRKHCCAAVKSLFTNEGKHSGEATVEAVQLIAEHVKTNNCKLHPDSVAVFMSLSFDEDLAKHRDSVQDKKNKGKKFKRRTNVEDSSKHPVNEWKKAKQEMMSKTREEVNAELKAASFSQDIMERRRLQSETLSAIFQTYFRILKNTMLQCSEGSSSSSAFGNNPLLAPCLDGIGKFSHLIDLDFMADLMNCLRRLAGGGSNSIAFSEKCSTSLSVSERLQCCIVAFKVMRNNLDALNIDLQEFFLHLYNLILEYRPGRDQGEVLAEALKIMLCDSRQHDMQRAAAFMKRLATFSLCFGCSETMAALTTLRHLLQKNAKCWNLLENDAGGGSVSGPISKYHPYVSDPNQSGALASVLWELNLLTKHYHPAVSAMASSISTMSASHSQALSNLSPPQAFMEFSLGKEPFNAKIDFKKLSKRTRVSSSVGPDIDKTNEINENEVRKKLSEHFVQIRDIMENERLRAELDRTTLELKLFEQYKKKKKRKLQVD